jgi:hypothetical protein
MSEDFMNVRGRHADTAELQPIDATAVVPYAEDVDLGSDPFADDLNDQLAARAPRRYYTRATAVLAALVLLAAGFFAGAQVQKNYGTSTNASGRTAGGSNLAGAGGAGNFGGGGFAGRQGGPNGGTGTGGATGGTTGGTGTGGTGTGSGAGTGAAAGGGNVTTGTVKLVDGTTVYIQTSDGTVVTVKTNGSTSVQVAQSGALSDLTPGAQVTVEGSAGSDGTVTATKVTKAR